MENNLVLFENKALAITKQLSDLKKEQERLEKIDKEARKALELAMQEYGVKQFKNEYVTISYVEGSMTTSLDVKKLEVKEPELFNELLSDYPKITERKSYVKILVK